MSSDDYKYVPEPLYPVNLLHIPYPKVYETLNLVLIDKMNGSSEEHISHFIHDSGPYDDDYNLHLK